MILKIGSVYKYKKTALNEKSKIEPFTTYGATKLAVEELLNRVFISEPNKWRIANLRYFNPVGSHSSGFLKENSKDGRSSNLFPSILKAIKGEEHNLLVFGNDWPTYDGTCVRDYMHVTDLSVAHVKALEYLKEKSKSVILNCGYGKGYSVLEILRIFKRIKKNLEINFVQRRKGDVAAVYSDTKKFKKTIKMKIKYNNISKILKSSIKWEKILKTRK